ncbi:LRRNT 2 domain-containing protein [Citrus sinensis]|uniref:LRRNT 2 domain-containing protein n=1 Tax=Citrus sinensis TaxID=2711 RepID=A0ACB8JMZ0_CITSI|nr:LRRNT 2 domain-containing protein [Citrus sinensis]
MLLFFITLLQVAAFEEGDRAALQAFKSMISHDPQGILNSWNDSRHFCEWEGITCGRRHRRVTALNMRSKALRGSLSPYIGNLSFLREINLENNTIQGEIPREFGRLLRLEALFLSNNSLAGKIPANLSSRLTVLALPYNKLVGRIPFEFVSLCKLKRLALHRNSLTGGIPPFLGNLSSLELLSLGANSFGGNIPDSLGQLKELEALGIGGNNLSAIGLPPNKRLVYCPQPDMVLKFHSSTYAEAEAVRFEAQVAIAFDDAVRNYENDKGQ